MRNGLVRMDERLTITLSGRRPVTVALADWPLVAEAEIGRYGHSELRLFIREHVDGRLIVYGIEAPFDPEAEGAQGGVVLAPGEDVGAAAKWLAERLNFPDVLVDTCLAKLSPEELV